VNVATLNVGGHIDEVKKEFILRHLKEERIPLLLVTEAKLLPTQEHRVRTADYELYASFRSWERCKEVYIERKKAERRRKGQGAGVQMIMPDRAQPQAGLFLWYKKELADQVEPMVKDEDGTFLVVVIRRPGQDRDILLIGVYAPSDSEQSRERFYEGLEDRIRGWKRKGMADRKGLSIVLFGDLNVTLNQDLDYLRPKEGRTDCPNKALANLMTSHGLSCCYRYLHPEDQVYTWKNRQKEPNKQKTLIDRFLADDKFREEELMGAKVEGFRVEFSPDHALTCIESRWLGGLGERGRQKLRRRIRIDAGNLSQVRDVLKEREAGKEDPIKEMKEHFKAADRKGMGIRETAERLFTEAHNHWKNWRRSPKGGRPALI